MSAPVALAPAAEKSTFGRVASCCSLDRAGMWISGACAIHCAVLPILLTIAGMGWLADERLEWSIIAASFLIGSVRLSHSYFYEHRRPVVLVIFLTGLAAILFAKAEFVGWEYAEVAGMTLGGSMIAFAHWRNHHFAHSAQLAPR